MLHFLIIYIITIVGMVATLSSCVGHRADGATENIAANSMPLSPSPISSVTTQQVLNRSHSQTVDFQNFTYPWIPQKYREFFGNRKDLEIWSGKLKSKRNDEASLYDIAVDVYYFDLDSDGIDEALVDLSLLLPNRAKPECLFVYRMNSYRPRLIWKHESGKWDSKGFKDFQYEPFRLTVEEFNDIDSPICCPKSFFRSIFEWRNNTLELVSEELIPYEKPSR